MSGSQEFSAKVAGALYGGAIGDGIGAPVEGLRREEILDLVGPVQGFIAPTQQVEGKWAFCDRPDAKGDGRITDDTLMVEALIEAYARLRDHMDAWAYRQTFAPILATRPIWLPELQRETVLLNRLAMAEQWHIRGLLGTHRDPRFFGATLYQISCGAGMCAWPIGAVNAGDPRGAYDEAVAFFSAQTYSYGLEQAAVMAAATAEAFAPDATARSVVDAAMSVARDGTLEMIRAGVGALKPNAPRDQDLPAVRQAVAPWHHKNAHVADTHESVASASDAATNRGLESRLHTSEEVPVALAMLLRADGAFCEAVCASAEYGEDADSIASMAGALAGALGGESAIPEDWRRYCDGQNRRAYAALAEDFAAAAQAIMQEDRRRFERRQAATGTGVAGTTQAAPM